MEDKIMNCDMEEQPILIYQKSAEPKTHKMIIPKYFIEKHGLYFKMKVYKNRIVITPIEKGE